MEYDRRNYEGLFYIAKCTRLKERVCLKDFGYHLTLNI